MLKRKKILIILSCLIIFVLLGLLFISRLLFGITIRPEGKTSVIYIPDNSSYEQAMDSVRSNLKISNTGALEWLARKKNYPSMVKPGRYVVNKGLSINELINILRSGKQTPVRITFNNIKTIYELSGKIGNRIEADSAEIVAFLSDPENYRADGFKREDIISVFLPDTYEVFWDIGAGELYSRMLTEYKRFWNDERSLKAEALGLTRSEVSTLASIIDFEVAKSDEKPRIAGVYINRLKRGIPLQADPTIKFAINDFSVKRILYKHLETDSPYNTYKHTGCPPGPISCPSIGSIDAVLNAEKHDYLFFVARADFSGYHVFSRTLAEHNRYAAQYQRELNKRKIFK